MKFVLLEFDFNKVMIYTKKSTLEIEITYNRMAASLVSG